MAAESYVRHQGARLRGTDTPDRISALRAIALTLALIVQGCIWCLLAPSPGGAGLPTNYAHEVEIQLLPPAPRPLRAKAIIKASRLLRPEARAPGRLRPSLTRGLVEGLMHQQPDLRGLAGALFGCTSRTAPMLHRASRPCPGVASSAPAGPWRGVFAALPQAKHALRWARALAQERSPVLLPGAFLAPLFYLEAVASGSIMDRDSIARDPARWPTYLEPGRFLTKPGPATGPLSARRARWLRQQRHPRSVPQPISSEGGN